MQVHVRPVSGSLGLSALPAFGEGLPPAGLPPVSAADDPDGSGFPRAATRRSGAVAQAGDTGSCGPVVLLLRMLRPRPAPADLGGCEVAVRPAAFGAPAVCRAAARPWPAAVVALVAQWIERPPPERKVRGSIPLEGAHGLGSSLVRRLACKAGGSGSSPPEASFELRAVPLCVLGGREHRRSAPFIRAPGPVRDRGPLPSDKAIRPGYPIPAGSDLSCPRLREWGGGYGRRQPSSARPL